MQNKQYELSLNVLRKLEAAGVLRSFVLVGSWCLVLYRDYFRNVGAVPAVRTRDMDFLVPSAAAIRVHRAIRIRTPG
ncbi:MAG: GSU2403 family nucleotidyltransferase fold protein [Kiritimatiellae bacterium]|nr:GSU2403 family nucleotidyltransferase fold protein [Kiritimatiellia bacterium]